MQLIYQPDLRSEEVKPADYGWMFPNMAKYFPHWKTDEEMSVIFPTVEDVRGQVVDINNPFGKTLGVGVYYPATWSKSEALKAFNMLLCTSDFDDAIREAKDQIHHKAEKRRRVIHQQQPLAACNVALVGEKDCPTRFNFALRLGYWYSADALDSHTKVDAIYATEYRELGLRRPSYL